MQTLDSKPSVEGAPSPGPGQDTLADAATTSPAPKPLFYLGDMSGGPIEALEARTLEDAIEEAKRVSQERAAEQAADHATKQYRTALQEWVVYSVDSDGEYSDEGSGIEQADPDEPECPAAKKHKWHNPDPEWAAYGNDQGGGVTVVRVCRKCGMERTERTWQSDAFGGHYDSVEYVEESDSSTYASKMAAEAYGDE